MSVRSLAPDETWVVCETCQHTFVAAVCSENHGEDGHSAWMDFFADPEQECPECGEHEELTMVLGVSL